MAKSQPDTELAAVFVAIADSLRDGYDIVDTMSLLVDSGTRFTSAVDAGVLLKDGARGLYVAASTSEGATLLEETQLGIRQGPCVESIARGEAVDVPDIAESADRWPDFAAVALQRGFRSVHATPLVLRDQTLGGLNLFAREANPFSEKDALIVSALAQLATITIVQHRAATSQSVVNAQLQGALESRVSIEQAKGIISEQLGVPVDIAFTRLRSHARASNVGLRATAAQVISRDLYIL